MKDSFFEHIKTKEGSLPEQTAKQISRLIAEQHLPSGAKLPSEFELAELLHVGRGTVREGVKLLVARNLLEIRRGKGTFITQNPGEVPDPLGFAFCPDQFRLALDLLEVRAQLEPWVAQTAAERATEENLTLLRKRCLAAEEDILTQRDHSKSDVAFHAAIAECTQNLVVPKLIPVITYAVTLFASLTENRLRKETLSGHQEILEAICRRDAEGAGQAMAQHIENNRILLAEGSASPASVLLKSPAPQRNNTSAGH